MISSELLVKLRLHCVMLRLHSNITPMCVSCAAAQMHVCRSLVEKAHEIKGKVALRGVLHRLHSKFPKVSLHSASATLSHQDRHSVLEILFEIYLCMLCNVCNHIEINRKSGGLRKFTSCACTAFAVQRQDLLWSPKSHMFLRGFCVDRPRLIMLPDK